MESSGEAGDEPCDVTQSPYLGEALSIDVSTSSSPEAKIMAQTFASTTSLVKSLSSLPTELAHQIIDDLRVKDILKLLGYDNERVTACIASHTVCRDLFDLTSDENIAKIRFAAQFYRELFREVSPPLSAEGWLEHRWLSPNIHCVALKDRDLILLEIRDHIHTELYLHWRKLDLTQLGAPDYPELNHHSALPPWNRFSFEDMKERWEEIKKAKAVLFKMRSSELDWASDMLEANPDILKRTLDPHQERRPNTTHIVSRMQNDSGKILRASGQKFVQVEHFKYEFFEVIPFDSALVELLAMMDKHRIVKGDQLTVNSAVDSGAVSHPSSILESAVTLAEGMSHFDPSALMTDEKREKMREMSRLYSFGSPDGIVVPRTGNTPWSGKQELVDGVKAEGPYFTPHKIGSDYTFRRPEICRWDPHGDGERKWLQAFVELYRYLKGLD
ncbi:unnamed protein product [Penicillium salamii]|uniref:F-box domain-containing protein n=1 Tax=Penicillium salamii TaxID=1612424 RepID=A0A9W4IEF0_9EURO|nr:unnamed protein product [Penicillium salamii]